MIDAHDVEADTLILEHKASGAVIENASGLRVAIASALRAAADGARREVAPTAEQMLGAYEAEINSRGIPPVAGPEYRAARLSLIRGTLARLPTPPQPDPVAVAREAVVRAAMKWKDNTRSDGDLYGACTALAELENKP